MSVRRSARSMLDISLATAEASAAMWTTLAIRVPQLMAGTMTERERRRMIGEKMEAAVESARAMAAAAATPTGLSPIAQMNRALAIVKAGSKPYHKRVKSNARRLSRAKG